MTCDIATGRRQTQIQESTLLSLSQTLKRFAKMSNNVTLVTNLMVTFHKNVIYVSM